MYGILTVSEYLINRSEDLSLQCAHLSDTAMYTMIFSDFLDHIVLEPGPKISRC